MSTLLDQALDAERLAQCRASDAALSATITRAPSSAQRAYDNRTDDRHDPYDDEIRESIARGAAKARAEQAMEAALFGAVPVAALKSNEGPHSPATLVSTMLGLHDDEVNGLVLQALRLACGPHHPNVTAERDAQASHVLRKLGELLCQRFGDQHFSAYVRGQA